MAATPDIDALVLEGQRLRQVNPRALLRHAELLQRAAGDNALTGGYAEVFAAWGLLAHGERPAAELALARARTLMAHSGDLEGQLMCRGLQADLFIRDGRLLEALEIARVTLAQPEDTLSVWERYRAHARRTTALERLDEHDAALRAHYETLGMARRSNEPALLANALGGVGGLQSSLLNLVDAITLCDEAWALCKHTDWHGVVQLVGANRLGVLSGLGRHDEAVAMAEALIAREPSALGLFVIDDDASVRDSLAALLERWGHRVMQGNDAPDALLQWQQLGRPVVDAAIIDLRLRAGRTGLQAIADLRAGIGAALPALVVTGDIAPGRLRLLADADQPWLPKPLMPMRLRSWLQALPPR